MTQTDIPQPPTRLIVGNMPELRRKGSMIESMMDLTSEYGGIVQLQAPQGRMIVVADADLAAELCDDDRFEKILGPGLLRVRQNIGDGLFTSYSHEKNWQLAHRILMPTFSHASMKAYVPDMVEMAEQLMTCLDKDCQAGLPIDVAAEMTKLTLDTIALCGFSYRFDSFRREDQHPFVDAMVVVLTENQSQMRRPAALNALMIGAHWRAQAAQKLMNDTVTAIIKERREGGARLQGRVDLLEHMLSGVDKVTGESLSDENIRSQCLTFLVAGHETTSGLLSFAVYYLLNNPEVAAKAQAEADRVLGTDLSQAPSYEQIHALDYITQILEETLRLWPTAPAFSRGAKREPGELIGGKYFIPYGQPVQLLLPQIHRSPKVWGSDAEQFNPDRFSEQAKASRPSGIYLPFGTGERACIGRQFAMQEAKLVLGMLMQRFDLVSFESYQLRVKQSLTIKPDGFRVKLRRRPRPLSSAAAESRPSPSSQVAEVPRAAQKLGVTLEILFGSNLGTCEAYAHELAHEAERRGFDVRASSLDDAAGNLGSGPVVIVASSYNGFPPDNAGGFCAWLQGDIALQSTPYAIFGCGNREWTNTYQAVPRALDEGLAAKGGKRLLERGEGDASGDLDGAFRAWKDNLWQSLYAYLGLQPEAAAPAEPLYSVEVLEELHPNPFAEVYAAAPMVVVENRELQNRDASGRSTRHLELSLPEGISYRPGDHLGVIPQNPPWLVGRAAAAFGYTPELRIQLHKRHNGSGALPTERIMSVRTLLTHYVELQDVATRHQLGILARHAASPRERERLLGLADDAERYTVEVKAAGLSLLDLLEEMPSVALPFGQYLEMVSPLRPRYYSISSSPEASGRLVSITVGVVEGPARRGHGIYQGVCSSYLASTPRGRSVYAFVQSAQGLFSLPENELTPLVMIGAGTGLAPYRGFLQERQARARAGRRQGPALLFFGCRHPEHDYLYRQELEELERQELVSLVTAFSRTGDTKVYVQDRLVENGSRIWQAIQDGGVLYVCGDAAGMAAGVRAALTRLVEEHGGLSAEDAQTFLTRLVAEKRYQLDVWAST